MKYLKNKIKNNSRDIEKKLHYFGILGVYNLRRTRKKGYKSTLLWIHERPLIGLSDILISA